MVKSILIAVFVFGQAVALFAAGAATLWWSGDLMVWLIWLVGEEYALGEQSVIRTEEGGTLLTNPKGMLRWTLPFLFLGILQMTAAFTLAWLGVGRLTSRCGGSRPPRAVTGDL
jgi:hypothetical protein